MRQRAVAAPAVFSFTDYREFLNAYYRERKARSASFSLRVWCRHLGLRSPATLNMILQGRRHAGEQVLEKLLTYFDFDEKEKQYFEDLTRLGKHRGGESRRTDILQRITALHPRKSISIFDLNVFAAMSNWYFYAIREMVSLPVFRDDPHWISQMLGGRVGARAVKRALRILLQLGILVPDADGRLRQVEEEIMTPADVPSEAVRRFHEQMLRLARESMRDTPLERREIRALTFNLAVEDLPRFKRELRQEMDRLYLKYQRADGDATYQFNMQLFPLTRVGPERKENRE